MEDAVPQASVLAVGEQDADFGVTVGDVAGHEIDGGPGEAAVGAVDEVQGDAGHAVLGPSLSELVGASRVDARNGPPAARRA